MLAGAKAQSGVQNDHGLTGARAAFDPTGFDQQGTAHFKGFEMLFPGFGPIFTLDAGDANGGMANIQPTGFDLLQAGGDLGAEVGGRKPFSLKAWTRLTPVSRLK